MIEIVHGKGVGAGKSYFVTTRIINHLAAGGTVYASDTYGLKWPETKNLVAERFGVELEDGQFVEVPEQEVQNLHEKTPPGTDEMPVLIVIDEAHTKLNARDYGDKTKRPFFNWLTQSRHDNNDLIFITQHYKNLDTQVVRLVTHIHVVRNMMHFSVPLLGPIPMRKFRVAKCDPDGTTVTGINWLKHDKGIFNCYESKNMKGAHRRLDAEVPRRILKKVKGKHMTTRIFLILAVVVGACAWFWKAWQGDKKPSNVVKEEKQVAVVDKPPAFAKAKVSPRDSFWTQGAAAPQALQVKPAYSIAAEGFRGSDGGRSFIRTDVGTYVIGEMSNKGFVENIKGDVAKIRTPEGGMLFVIAEQRAANGQTMVVNGDPGAVVPKREIVGTTDRLGYVAGNVGNADAPAVTVNVNQAAATVPEKREETPMMQKRRLQRL